MTAGISYKGALGYAAVGTLFSFLAASDEHDKALHLKLSAYRSPLLLPTYIEAICYLYNF